MLISFNSLADQVYISRAGALIFIPLHHLLVRFVTSVTRLGLVTKNVVIEVFAATLNVALLADCDRTQRSLCQVG